MDFAWQLCVNCAMRRAFQIKERRSRVAMLDFSEKTHWQPIRPAKHRGVRKGVRFIETNYFKPIDVKALAAVCGLSCRGLHDAFQMHLGVSPGEVLRQRRLQAAKNYLFNSEHSLGTIAALSGYRNANSLWVAFRNATGFSPGDYRKRLQFETRPRHSVDCSRDNVRYCHYD